MEANKMSIMSDMCNQWQYHTNEKWQKLSVNNLTNTTWLLLKEVRACGKIKDKISDSANKFYTLYSGNGCYCYSVTEKQANTLS